MERNIYDVNREPYANDFAEPFWQRVVGDGFFGDLTKKLVSSAGEKAASAIGAKAVEAAPTVEENKGYELVKLLQVENKLQSGAPRVSRSNIHEIYNRLLSDE